MEAEQVFSKSFEPDRRVDLLTAREIACLRLVARHRSSREIASELGISKTSVDTYCDRARAKLQMSSRRHAARLVLQVDRAESQSPPDLTGKRPGGKSLASRGCAAHWRAGAVVRRSGAAFATASRFPGDASARSTPCGPGRIRAARRYTPSSGGIIGKALASKADGEGNAISRLKVLTPRERDCLRLVVEHHSSKEIGRHLGISQTSVDTYVRRARDKLGQQDR